MREARPHFDVFVPFEGNGLLVKHHCKAHAVREMAPRHMWDQASVAGSRCNRRR